MQNIVCVLLLAASTSALFTIQNPGADTDEESSRTDSLLYPLIMNPWQVSHWNCFGRTFYENTNISDDYTYSVDVCFTAVIAAKLLFPWFYQVQTGHSLLEALGIPAFGSQHGDDEYVSEGYAAPAVDEYGAPAYQESYGAPKPVYGSHEQRRYGKAPSFRERLSIAYKDIHKAIKKNNPLNSHH